MRTASARDFGLTELDALVFDNKTMTVTGCRCLSCVDWKSLPENRRFWQMKACKHPEWRSAIVTQKSLDDVVVCSTCGLITEDDSDVVLQQAIDADVAEGACSD